MTGFAKHAILMFAALRIGDIVNLAAGMWFVPRFVSPEEIGAVLPVTSFATFLSLPVFAFAMAVMKESATLASCGDRGRIKSLLGGVFAVSAAVLAIVLAASTAAMPFFLDAMGVADSSVGLLVVAAAFMGCAAPVYTDALQSLKRFRPLAAVEIAGAVARFAVMAAAMPVRALAGYFAGQCALPVVRMAGSVFALRHDLAVSATRYWNAENVRRLVGAFAGILAYQAVPMAASLVEQSLLRTALPAADSAGYYMATRFSDFLFYLTFPLLIVMFPYTATAAKRNADTRPYVVKCSAATLSAAALMAVAYAFFGRELIALMPNGSRYAEYAPYMPTLVLAAALTSCQVFFTNAEVSAGRFAFLHWLLPLHIVYIAALVLATLMTPLTLDGFTAFIAGVSIARFAFAAASMIKPCAGRTRVR